MALGRQTNLAVNTNKSQVYFEDSSTPLSYNFKTDQWSSIPDYAGIGFYDVLSGLNIGLVRTSGTAVDLQQPAATNPDSEAVITTGEASFSDGGRRMITGVRPLVTGADGRVSVAYRDLLNPDSATNFILWSEDLSNAAWTKSDATITTNQIVAPDGTTTADLFAGDGSGTSHYVEQQSATHADNANVKVAFYAKINDASYVECHYKTGKYVAWNVSNGSVAYTDYDPDVTGFGSDPVGNSWYRFQIFFDSTETTTTVRLVLSDGSAAEQNASTGLYLWGISVVPNATTSVYTKTEGAAASGSLVQTAEQTVNSRTGVAPFRAESRFHRIKLRMPAGSGFDTMLGADVEFEPSGEI